MFYPNMNVLLRMGIINNTRDPSLVTEASFAGLVDDIKEYALNCLSLLLNKIPQLKDLISDESCLNTGVASLRQ